MITKSQINLLRSLKDKASRSENQLFITEGEKMFDEIFNSSFFIKNIYFIENSVSDKTLENISKIKKKKNICVETVSTSEMERISQLKTPTSILTVCSIPKWDLNIDNIKNNLTIALDGVQDPGNLGTIIRIADWFGIKDIFCSFVSADVFNPKVVQATMGAITRVKVHYVNLVELLSNLKQEGTAIYGTFLEGTNIYTTQLKSNGVIVMGNEGRGVSREVEAIVSDKLNIPSYPIGDTTSESLNVSVATAIVCSEFRRR